MISNMNWQVVHLQDVAPTAWRNGGGTTRELVALPDAQHWRWRASVAEVTQSGLFSSFEGVQRWFAVLEGDGVCLTLDGHAHMLRKSDQPLKFDGAALTNCTLLGGATQDFNLMLHGSTSAHLQRVNSHVNVAIKTPKIIAVYTHKERATVQIDTAIHALSTHSLGWMHVDAGTAIDLQASDALWMEIDL